MINYTVHTPKFIHTIDVHHLPENYKKLVSYVSLQDEYKMIDNHDGNYYYLIDLSLASKDPVTDEMLSNLIENDIEPENYEFSSWDEHVPYDCRNNFHLYLKWLSFMRYLVANLPEKVVKMNQVALDVWH
jgi:hypothetical protein